MDDQRPTCLLLGSNIQPEDNVVLAVDQLARSVRILRLSSVWETPSVGFAGPNFLNLALLIATPLDAESLKQQIIHPLENRLGRVRTSNKNAPRTMDIDLILFEGEVVDANLWRYAFRAVPVAELLPDLLSAEGCRLADAAAELIKAVPIHLRPDVMQRLAESLRLP